MMAVKYVTNMDNQVTADVLRRINELKEIGRYPFMGRPKATEQYSSKILSEKGMIGVYETDDSKEYKRILAKQAQRELLKELHDSREPTIAP